MEFRVDFVGSFKNVRRTPQGGLEVPANLTRTGVFQYIQPDGTIRRELRPPQEVFVEDSLATLKGAPLTVGHPGVVRTDNWQQLAVGHVSDDVKAGGPYVQANVRVQTKDVVDKVERGDLVELSCGYTCDLELSGGEYNGEKYDAVQRNIRYNHVALGPRNFGRAGNEVRLRLDSGEAVGVLCYTYSEDNCPVETENMAQYKELEASLAAKDGELAGAKARIDALETELKAAKALDVDALVNDRLALFADAKSILGDVKLDGKKDTEIMSEACAKAFPGLKLDSANEDYLRGLFSAAVVQSKSSAVKVAKANVRVDSGSVQDKISAARKRNEERSRNAWKVA